MVPEGLQYASAETIADEIASLGMNVIRLAFATEMIDDIYETGDVDLKTTFVESLGEVNGTKVYEEVLRHNPQFNAKTTRMEVSGHPRPVTQLGTRLRCETEPNDCHQAFDAVAAACAERGIMVHLDNHQVEAGWCCSATDGNGWFGDTYFNVSNWMRGLEYMSRHVRSSSSHSSRPLPRRPWIR